MTAIPSERELQALKILWQRGEATVREVYQALTDKGETLAYTTVLSLLQVMEQKELVGHHASGKTYNYFPLVQRESTFRSLAKGFLETVFDGAMDEYLIHALDSQQLSPADLSRLEQMIAQAKAKGTGDSNSVKPTKINKPSTRRGNA